MWLHFYSQIIQFGLDQLKIVEVITEENKIKEDLEQWMKMASFNWLAFSTEVVLFQVLPIATSNKNKPQSI